MGDKFLTGAKRRIADVIGLEKRLKTVEGTANANFSILEVHDTRLEDVEATNDTQTTAINQVTGDWALDHDILLGHNVRLDNLEAADVAIQAVNATQTSDIAARLPLAGGTLTGTVTCNLGAVINCRMSYLESWWSHTALNNLTTDDATNTLATTHPAFTATSFYFPPALATSGINNLVPVLTNGGTPRVASTGPNNFLEWQQTFTSNRTIWTYNGPIARRFMITAVGNYVSTSNNDLIVFQAFIRRSTANVPSMVNGTTSSWFQTDTNRIFTAVSRKNILLTPGESLEVAIGIDPLVNPPGTNSTICRDLIVTFEAMLNTNV